MKFNYYLTMLATAMAVMFGFCSCGDDDDEPEVAVATQVAGSYTGNEIITVMGEESSNGTATYEFVKSSDNTIDMTIPESGEMGNMSIPKLLVKNIPLVKSDNTISGKVASFTGTVTNAAGAEKTFSISNITVLFNGKNAVVSFSLKYGNMPMSMETTFTGTKN